MKQLILEERPLTIADRTQNLLYSEAAKHDRLQAGQNGTGEVREKWKGSDSVRSIISKDGKNISQPPSKILEFLSFS